MTVIYSSKVATANFSCFFKLLMRWRGSIYKILWKEFAIFASAYFFLSFIYRMVLNEELKLYFEMGAQYCSQFNNLIPVAFVLGFYVNHVASRWWEKFRTLPWPGRMAMYVTAHLHGHDERARLMRRTIMRYMCLSYVMTMSSISPPVKKRFPNLSKMTEAGLMLSNEEMVINNISTNYNKFFIPLVWASAVVTRARKEGRIKDDFAVKTLIDEINDYRTRSFQLFNFDWVTIPLVYTQVVTLAVYTFFLSCLMGRQHLENGNPGEMNFPLFTFLQFLFYMGWLKVAETMLNPFGEDDDDFDINYLIDRHLKVSYLVVDEMHNEHPDLIKDQYWDSIDFQLPYTADQQPSVNDPMQGSAIDIQVPPEKSVFVPSSLSRIDEGNEDIYPQTGTKSSDFKSSSSSYPSKPYKLNRAFSKASNSSKSSHSLKTLNFFKNIKRSFSIRRNSAAEFGGLNLSPINTNPINVVTVYDTHEKQPHYVNIPVSSKSDINKPFDNKDDEIFHMSLEDDVDDSLISCMQNNEKYSLKPRSNCKSSFQGSNNSKMAIISKGKNIKRNSTETDLEMEKIEHSRFVVSPFKSHNNLLDNIGLREDDAILTPIVEDFDCNGNDDNLMEDMKRNLRKIQSDKAPDKNQMAIAASYNSQIEILSLLNANMKNNKH